MGYALIIWKFNYINSSRSLTKNTICNWVLSVKKEKGRKEPMTGKAKSEDQD